MSPTADTQSLTRRHPLAWLRFERNLSLSALAEVSGVSRTTLFRIESRKVRPHRRTVFAIADALDYDRDLLLEVFADA